MNPPFAGDRLEFGFAFYDLRQVLARHRALDARLQLTSIKRNLMAQHLSSVFHTGMMPLRPE